MSDRSLTNPNPEIENGRGPLLVNFSVHPRLDSFYFHSSFIIFCLFLSTFLFIVFDSLSSSFKDNDSDLDYLDSHYPDNTVSNLNVNAVPFVPANDSRNHCSDKESVDDAGNICDQNDMDVYSTLKNFRIQNLNRIIIGNLNINSLRNKHKMLTDIVIGKIDILLITESKLGPSFPSAEFRIPSFSNPYRRDRNCFGGGIILYIRDDIPCKLLPSDELLENIECLMVEIILKKAKWLIVNFYNPSKTLISKQLALLSKAIDHYISNYDNILIMGDFNSEMAENPMIEFCSTYNLKNLVIEPTCFKNPENPSCIDLMLTNRRKSFLSNIVVETGLSDCHKMTVSALKTTFKKYPPKIVAYRDFKKFSNDLFSVELNYALEFHDTLNINFDLLNDILMSLVNKHAPIKYKYMRANQGLFVNKELRKAIMTRSRLKNRSNRVKTDEAKSAYKRQRNYCTNLLRKNKIDYFKSLHPSSLTDNKTFWKAVKPAFTDKVCCNESITLVDNEDIISDDDEVVKIFNKFS